MKKIYFIAIVIVFFISGCFKLPESTDKNIDNALIEKARRVGIYLAASKQAEEAGNSEAAVYLGEIAEEEIKHIKNLSIIQVHIGRNTKSSLKKILKIEKEVSRITYPKIARIARDEGKEEIADLFEKMAQDEKRHYLGLKGIRKTKN